MKYLGGKSRIAKYIVPFIQRYITSETTYYEPFMGAGWIFTKVRANKKIGSDIHNDLMLLWQALADGWVPPNELTVEEYNALKTAEPSPLRGFAGFACSFGGKWFGGYARPKRGISDRGYAREGRNSLLRKVELLKQNGPFELHCRPYTAIERIEQHDVVYCDPPYARTTRYRDQFNHEDFWNWVRDRSQEGMVIVSEYAAPEDFRCVLEVQTSTDLHGKDLKNIPRTERLFMHNTIVDRLIVEKDTYGAEVRVQETI